MISDMWNLFQVWNYKTDTTCLYMYKLKLSIINIQILPFIKYILKQILWIEQEVDITLDPYL